VLVEDRQIVLHEGEPKEVEEKVIDALSLSSGERHLLTMFLYLIREIKNDGSLILIDEPEMSLHINWQRRFIDDLLETLVKRYSELEGNPLWTSPHRFLIATHSPSIIANHLEHGIELGIGDLPQEEW